MSGSTEPAGQPVGSLATNRAATALATPLATKTPPTPNHATPMSTPARAGANTRIASCDIWARTTAFWRSDGGTTSEISEIRAGR